MPAISFETLFPNHVLNEIFPPDRADRFFDALFGNASEGAYDIGLAYVAGTDDQIEFEFQLKKRHGKCLACNLTHGLPQVFMRHPIIDINGVIRQIDSRISSGKRCNQWILGSTQEISSAMHVMPLTISLISDDSSEPL